MSKKLEQVLGLGYLRLLQSKTEELEQELLIEEWKHPGLSSAELLQRATLNVLYDEYKFYKYHYRLRRLKKSLVAPPKDPIISEPVGLFLVDYTEPMFKHLTSYERYVVSLLSHNSKKEVSRLLNCSCTYLSKLLDSVKNKLLKY